MKPLVCIVDASIGVTGALVAARREAALLADRARFMLVLPETNRVANRDLPEFERIERLPLRPLRRTFSSAVSYFPALVANGARLRRLLRQSGCDRLQVNDFYLAESWVARRLGFRGRIVSWVRIDPSRFGLIGRWWLRAAFKSSDHVVAVSEFIQRQLQDDQLSTLLYDPAPIATPVEPSGQRLLFVGNYTEGKGHQLAIAAFHRLAENFPKAELVIHGDAFGLARNEAYRERLVDVARRGPGYARISIGGFAEDLPKAYAQSLAALNCSASESFSLTCLDASAHGLPVIATRCGGPEEIIDDGVNGLLVPVGDVAAIETAMRQLLSDSAFAKNLGRNGAALMKERFGEGPFIERVSELLDLPRP